MTLELAIVEDDLTTVLMNLNGLGQGNATGFEVKSWNLGQVVPETQYISNPAYPGAVQTVTHHGPVAMELSLQAQHTTYDALRDLVGSLAPLLREGGFMRYKFDGQTNYHFIEYFGSQLPQLIRGDNDVTQKYIVERFQDLTGFPLVIERQPYIFRETRTVVNSQSISNTDMTVDVTVQGDLPALTKITAAVVGSGSETVEMRVARKSIGNLTEYAANFVRYDITSPTGLLRRWQQIDRKVLSPTDTTALIGTYRVRASFRVEDEDEYWVQLRWNTVDEEPAGAVNDPVLIDSADTSSMPKFADVNLGTVRFDRAGAALALELWARREGTGTSIQWNDVWLEPIDEMSCRVTSPGFRFGKFGREVSTGNELGRFDGASVDDDDRAVLNEHNEYAETEETELAAGMHLVQFIGTIINFDKERTEVGVLSVLENGIADDSRRVKLTSRRKHTRKHYDWDNPKQVAWKVTDTNKLYKWRVRQTVDHNGSRSIKIAKLIYSFIPILQGGRRFVIDGIERTAYIANSSGVRYYPAHLTGPFITLEPGANVLVFRLGDVSTKSVYREADARGVLAEMWPDREANVTIEVRERFLV